MSVISTFYNTAFTIKRTTTTSSKSTDTASTITTGYCAIRPITDRTQLFDSARYGREFKMWCDESVNIKEGDSITIGSTIYTVAGISDYTDYVGDERHLEITVYK